MNCFQVDDSGGASEVEEILAQATIAGSSSLLSSDMSKAMFHGDAFAQKLATFGGSNELAQAMLQSFVSGDVDGAAASRSGHRAVGAHRTACARFGIELDDAAWFEALDLAGRADDGQSAHVDAEVSFCEAVGISRDPGFAEDLAATPEDITDEHAGDVAPVDVKLLDLAAVGQTSDASGEPLPLRVDWPESSRMRRPVRYPSRW